MDITIGIAENGRQLTLTVDRDQDAVEKLVIEALAGSVLKIDDDKGRRFIVPTAKIAFVEIGVVDSRKVGFTRSN
ncbi:MAG: DUF3107 domain-containing protein [Nakamurella sp.]